MKLEKVNTLTLKDAAYPAVLRHIYSKPKNLFYRGAAPSEWLDKPRVAIVGSRKLTGYGRTVTERIAGDLARSGVVIVSGLAYGIDATAHRAALEAGGLTVAVLAVSVEEVYPSAHLNLAESIIKQGGSLISEYPSGTKAFPGNFVARNRIVSGLADVLLITEAALKSGSLHTARYALEQGKTVMAVPGSILSPASEGCNNLIKSGAVPVTNAGDVFFALGLDPMASKKTAAFHGSLQEETILRLIRGGMADQEDIARAAGLDGAQIASSLTSLEIAGHIRPAGAGNWLAS